MINLVVALPIEAKPLIARYELKGRTAAAPFSVYESGRLRLIVSGVGKVSAASAVGYLGSSHAGWLNIGVAGHATRPVGHGLLAHKITDRASGESRYPPLVFDAPGLTGEVVTVDRITRDYPAEAAIDMEASGFYAAACRFSTAELVHCYKIISDNLSAPAHAVRPETVEGLVRDHLPAIDAIVMALLRLTDELRAIEADPPEFARFMERWHFSVTEQHRLRRLLKRRKVLAPERPVLDVELDRAKNAGDVLARLERDIESIPIRL